MAYFFQKNKQRTPQWNPRRRGSWGPIPQIVLHTFEWPANRSMLSAATYLLNRTTYGSYHTLAGGTSRRDVLRLAPVTAETWHCVPSNNWASGVSATTYAANWNKLSPTQRRNFVHSMAYASYLLSQELIAIGRSPVPAKRISRAEAMRGVWGFTYHRTMDPGRRTDPANPESAFPWAMFLEEYNRLMGNSSTPDTGKDWLNMATKDEVRALLREELDRYAAQRPSGPEGSREHRLRYHDRDSQLLYGAIAGLEVPLVRAKVDAIADSLAGHKLDERAVAEHVALLIEPTLAEALSEAVSDHPGIDPNAVAAATVSSLGKRLSEEN